MPPKISCVIPTLGRGPALCDTVRMLLGQTHPAHEIILVDQTPAYRPAEQHQLSQWAGRGAILWLRQKEPNASRARNRGALAACGDLLLFLDDDIRVAPDFLAAYVDVFVRTGAAGMTGPVLEGEAGLTYTLDESAFTTELGWLVHFRKNYARACETSFMMSGNVAVRRELFLALGGMDENYERGAHREESDFAMRFRQAGHRFQYHPRCAIYHLGPQGVPGGGARNGSAGKDFHYFHHCVGDWYFNLKFGNRHNLVCLLRASLRHFIFNRQTLQRPWRFPMALAYWLLALPPAVIKRLNGERLLRAELRGGNIPRRAPAPERPKAPA